MAVELWVALIAGVLALASVGVTLWGQRSTFRWQSAAAREAEARALLSTYREPLLRAAFDLQSRLYNIVELEFFRAYPPTELHEYSRRSTLWLVGQYLGWVEIVRRDVQFLDLGTVRKNRRLVELLAAVGKTFASDATIREPAFRLFRADQRAIGELMIVPAARSEGDVRQRSECLGYAAFCERLESGAFGRWFDSLVRDIDLVARHPDRTTRLVWLQRALIDLIWFLDEGSYRFVPDEVGKVLRGTEPLPTQPVDEAGRHRHASFRIPFIPWPTVQSWAHQHGYAEHAHSGPESACRFTRRETLFVQHVVDVRMDGERATVTSWIEPVAWVPFPRRTWAISDRGWFLWPTRRATRVALNHLLREFGRPEIPDPLR